MDVHKAELLSFQEAAMVAKDLGVKLNRSTFYMWAKRGMISSVKIKGKRLVVKSEFINKLKR